MNSQHKDLMDKINATGDLNDEITNGMKSAIEAFKSNSVW